MDNDNTIKTINNLIVVLKDADLGFHAAAEEVRDTSLKTQLHGLAQQCSTMWGVLQGEVRELGGDPKVEGTFTGKCKRIWTEIKTAFTDKDESLVLGDIVSAQESVQQEFEDALAMESLPSNIKEVISTHYKTVRNITSMVQAQLKRFADLQNI